MLFSSVSLHKYNIVCAWTMFVTYGKHKPSRGKIQVQPGGRYKGILRPDTGTARLQIQGQPVGRYMGRYWLINLPVTLYMYNWGYAGSGDYIMWCRDAPRRLPHSEYGGGVT